MGVGKGQLVNFKCYLKIVDDFVDEYSSSLSALHPHPVFSSAYGPAKRNMYKYTLNC